jgi:hypothetical protein
MPTTLKPIETSAFGRLFRSRLEARCAVFLEAMGLEWEYEPQGYDLPSGCYLPDFKVYDADKPGGFYWLECKGGVPTHQEVNLALELTDGSMTPCAFFTGKTMDKIRTCYITKFCSDGYYYPRTTYLKNGTPAYQDSTLMGWSLGTETDRVQKYKKQLNRFVMWEASRSYASANRALKARFEHGSRWI